MFKQILPLLSILVFRFLGLFIVLPVISLLISTMPDANAITIGIVIGAPYLFQVLCQPFFGRWSDKYGRKPILILGLIIFLIGSIICMLENSIYYLIIGRCIQGMGAIGGILTALVADYVPEEKRTNAMALMGIGIFISFITAMILGAIIGTSHGLNALFGLTVTVTLISLGIAIFFVKSPPKILYSYSQDSQHYMNNEMKRSIVIMGISNFLEKFLMIFTFAITPIILNQYLEKTDFWKVYILGICIAMIGLGPSSVLSEKRGKSLQILLISIMLFLICYIGMGLYIDSVTIFIICLVFFFVAFSIQEALLQSLVSKYAKARSRGAVIGDFSAAGFAGSFVGAMVGGMFHDYQIIEEWHGYFSIILVICLLLWGITVKFWLANPHNAKTLYVHTSEIKIPNDTIESALQNEHIIEWYRNMNENTIVIKYRIDKIDSEEILQSLGSTKEKYSQNPTDKVPHS